MIENLNIDALNLPGHWKEMLRFLSDSKDEPTKALQKCSKKFNRHPSWIVAIVALAQYDSHVANGEVSQQLKSSIPVILLNAEELADALGVKYEVVLKMITAEACPIILIPGDDEPRFYPAHVVNWLIEQTIAGGVRYGNRFPRFINSGDVAEQL